MSKGDQQLGEDERVRRFVNEALDERDGDPATKMKPGHLSLKAYEPKMGDIISGLGIGSGSPELRQPEPGAADDS